MSEPADLSTTFEPSLDADAEHDFGSASEPLGFEVDYALESLIEQSAGLSSIRDHIRLCVSVLRAHDVFVGHGGTDHFSEAAAMVLHTLNLTWSADPEILDARLMPIEKDQVLKLLSARVQTRKPLSYLINLSYFCGLPFYVDERVLIPRSPIAELINKRFAPFFTQNASASQTQVGDQDVDHGFDHGFDHGLPALGLPYPEQMLDLCTGSGCIALALANVFVDAAVDAVDIDDDALEVAAINIDHHAKGFQVNLIKSSLFERVSADNQYGLIVTNPPYVDAEDMSELPPEIQHEPELALAAGHDGLDLVHHILNDAPDYLTEQGLIVVEVGNSEWAMRQSYPEVPFHWLKFEKGGTGIFALTREQLIEHRAQFAGHAAACPVPETGADNQF